MVLRVMAALGRPNAKINTNFFRQNHQEVGPKYSINKSPTRFFSSAELHRSVDIK